MTTSQRAGRRHRPGALVVRTATVAAAIFVVVSSPSAVADLGTSPSDAPPSEPEAITAGTASTIRSRAVSNTKEPATQPAIDQCTVSPQDCAAPATPTPEQIKGGVPSCEVEGRVEPKGTLSVVAGPENDAASDEVLRFRVEVEDGLSIDPHCFADAVTTILTEDDGWMAGGTVNFERVNDDSFDFRVILASPDTTNTLCYPAATGGKYSCRNQERVVLNLMRWQSGAEDFGDDMDTYRRYLVNHEVGHYLGKSHLSCPGPDEAAPVMMQQTKSVGECSPNGTPTKDES